MPVDHVTRAIEALRHLGVNNRDDARRLIAMYGGRRSMTREQVEQVVEAFPPGAPDTN